MSDAMTDGQHDTSAGEGKNTAAPEGQTTTAENSGEITFTPEQQAHIDRILKGRLAEQKRALEAEAKKARQQAEMTELQQAQARLEELTAAHSAAMQELRSLKTQRIAADAGALYPDLIAEKLSDEALNGDKQAREREIARLRKDYPGLFRTGSADGGAQGRAVESHDMNALLRRAAGRG